ncbi:MAG TPA: bifunctional diguanylate cyclase/phosphodiesterase [Devosia sp.]
MVPLLHDARHDHSRQVSFISATIALLIVTMVGLFGWWAAERIDARSIDSQRRSVNSGVTELGERVVVEQDSSAVWDDAVINLRERNDPWLAENLAEWVSSYFGHDKVYLLDPDDRVIRAVANGERVPDEAYEGDRTAIDPLVRELRRQMAQASKGLADSTKAISGLGVLDRVALDHGQVGIVSVRPVIPGTPLVHQAPGEEYLHVSIRLLDADVSERLAKRFDLDGLVFERAKSPGSDHVSTPVLSESGRIMGFYTWWPYRPAVQLLRETAPATVGAAVLVGLVVFALMRRLRRTSAQLEVSERRAKYLAFHDALAAIPNRALFEDRLERALASRRRTRAPLVLHFIDVDRFKHVNDTLGHAAGDELIRQTAQRLRVLVSDADTVARIGGDEFAILQVDVRDVEEALQLSARIVEELGRPFELDGHCAQVGASVGLAMADGPDINAEDLMRHADLALYEAKANGRGRYQLFAGELDTAVKERRALELELRTALVDGTGLELVYQPIFDTHGAELLGAEALVRWTSPTRGRLAPDMFISLAEERGLIDQLGLWVLRNACAYASSASVPWVAVNVSPIQFRGEHFADQVLEVLRETGLPAARLELEITEGLLLQNAPNVQQALRKLRAAGLRIALDDFGTGYSSISYLRTYGVDKLKIDRSYIGQLGQDAEVDHIVRCIIELARAMNMKVTAEGVETERQQILLHHMACDQLQGYLLSRPVTAELLEEIADQAVDTRSQARG